MSLNRAIFDQQGGLSKQGSIQATPLKQTNAGFFINNDSSDSLENTDTKLHG